MPTRRELANVIRVLAMDAVEKANSGHPGAPMGMADIAEVLWHDFLKYNPGNPRWWNRDRFILSNGHACMLQYAVLHLTGYPLSMDDIKQFRQVGSRTPGHPEYNPSMGIETTSGPLGQGLATSVGFALAEKMLAAEFNRPGLPIVDHHTWVFMGDGCLMEGVSHEACSFAGMLRLGKLIGVYDDNGISIDGRVEGWFRDDTPARFEAYGWHVIRDVDGLDDEAIVAAMRAAKAETERPSLICCKTVIGWGAPTKAGTKEAHGEALGPEELAGARRAYNWTEPPFVVPEPLRVAWDHRQAGREAEAQWQQLYERYRGANPELAREFERRMRGELPPSWSQTAAAALTAAGTVKNAQATRQSSQAALNIVGPQLPELFGGSADLTTSNSTLRNDSRSITAEDDSGNYLHYGVREFGMTAAMTGIALHGGFIPYGGTFLTFSDYARNAVRLAAMMRAHSILVYSHDSIGLGEDGPTHQPIEQLSSLRLIPQLSLWRPADAFETAVAWAAAIEHHGPTCLILTRQGLPQLPRTAAQAAAVRRGGYVLLDCQGAPECIVIATGSEVQLALAAVQAAQARGQRARVVSLPCVDEFERQDAQYRESVLPAKVKARVAVEAGATGLWWRYVGSYGRVLGIDHFGESGKGPELFKKFGFTADNVSHMMDEAMAGAGQ